MGARYRMLKCEVCGKEYRGYHTSKCCSDECKREKRRMEDRERINELRRERLQAMKVQERASASSKSITEIAIKAREAGMTYGKYVSMMGL